MEADERELLLDTIEALGVLTFALGATFAGLKQEVTNLKPRLLVALNTAATNAPAVAARGGCQANARQGHCAYSGDLVSLRHQEAA